MLRTKHSKAYYIFYKFLQIIASSLFKIMYRVEVIDSHKIPKKGRIILCSNHMSYFDPLLICAYFPRTVYFMAKRELFKNKILSSIVTFFNAFPVNRFSMDRRAISNSVRVLNDEQVLGLFPEGTRSTDGVIREGNKGVGLISMMAKSPIIPVALVGSNKIVQKPHKRLFFPKIKLIYGDVIKIDDILAKHNKKEAINLIVKKVMSSIKKLYEKIK